MLVMPWEKQKDLSTQTLKKKKKKKKDFDYAME
jgi:hypothetical protein